MFGSSITSLAPGSLSLLIIACPMGMNLPGPGRFQIWSGAGPGNFGNASPGRAGGPGRGAGAGGFFRNRFEKCPRRRLRRRPPGRFAPRGGGFFEMISKKSPRPGPPARPGEAFPKFPGPAPARPRTRSETGPARGGSSPRAQGRGPGLQCSDPQDLECPGEFQFLAEIC